MCSDFFLNMVELYPSPSCASASVFVSTSVIHIIIMYLVHYCNGGFLPDIILVTLIC